MCGEGQDLLSIPEQSRSVKPVGVNGLASVRTAASGTGSRIFSHYVTHDGSGRMKLVLERKTFRLPTKRQERPDGSGDSPKNAARHESTKTLETTRSIFPPYVPDAFLIPSTSLPGTKRCLVLG